MTDSAWNYPVGFLGLLPLKAFFGITNLHSTCICHEF